MPPGESADRTILHVDMDAFYVSVELLSRPELRGKPVIVGGDSNRGVVAAASYEARAYGVHSALSSVIAKRRCPQAVFVSGKMSDYMAISARVMEIFASFTPLVEPISLDEAFLDVSGALRLHGDGPTVAQAIRSEVAAKEGLPCSVGVARTKFLAKLGSQAAKPTASRKGPLPGLGVKVIDPDDELAFLHALDATALWGVGPATKAKLDRIGVHTVADLARLPREALISALGAAAGRHLHDLAWGRDPRPVTPSTAPRSIGHEETYPVDIVSPEALRAEVVRLADAAAQRVRNHGLGGRTVTLKVRYGDFETITRSRTVPNPMANGRAVAIVAKELLDEVPLKAGVRLLGVNMSNLGAMGDVQLTLGLDEPETAADTHLWDDATNAIDEIRSRFGDAAIAPAVVAMRGTKSKGDQQWGPTRESTRDAR